MSKPTLRTPGMLVLSNRAWLEELSLELVRLGHDPEQAERSARSMLVRIVGRAQWPRQAFLVDEQPALEEAGA